MRVRFSPSLLCLWPSVLLGCPQASTPEARDGGVPLCGPSTLIKSVAWNERTMLGVTPREAFAPALLCEARLRWDGRWQSDLLVQPVSGQTSLTLRATPRENTVQLISPARDAPEMCPPFSLRVQADLRVETADGTFAGGDRSELIYSPGRPVGTAFQVPITGAVAMGLRVDDPRDFYVRYVAEWLEHGCEGDIGLTTPTDENRFVWHLGGWSSTRCAGHGTPTPIQDAELPDDLDGLLEAFNGAFAGQWEDGQPAELHVQVARDGDLVCTRELRSGLDVAVPVKLLYGTSDGRIAEHEAEGHLLLNPSTGLRVLRTSEHLVCDDAEDALAYPPCSGLVHALVSLRLTHGMEEVTSSMEPALRIDEFEGRVFDVGQTLAFELKRE